MKKITKSLLMTLSMSVIIPAYAEQQLIDQIEKASMTMDISSLERLSSESQGYDQALAFYRLGLNYNLTSQQSKAIDALEVAGQLLQAQLQHNPQDVESWALLAQIYGLRIAFEPMKGAYYGPKSAEAIATASHLDETNPRVQLIRGISDFNTPAVFGGSNTAAVAALDRAISYFPADSHSGVSWGHAEAYTWRGLAHIALGNQQQALSDWQHALKISPQYGWAKMLLTKHSQ